jgi:transcriptional regulator with XRE-family HTH domain
MHLTVRRLRRFESGANVTLLTLERIARALGVETRDLLVPPLARETPGPGRPRKAPLYPPTAASREKIAVAERPALAARPSTKHRRSNKR